MVLLEAMALGKPIVASAVGGVPELLGDWPAAWLIPPRDERALTEACLDAINGGRTASDALNRQRPVFDARKGYSLMCDATHALYRTLAGRQGRGPTAARTGAPGA